MNHYFDTAASGLVPKKYLKAQQQFMNGLSTQASGTLQGWYSDKMDELRYMAAEFLGANHNEIAFLPNFSYGLFALIQSLPADSKVLMLHEDYPSVFDPFKLSGFAVHRHKSAQKLHFSEEEIMVALMDKKANILAISHVQWLSGYCADINGLCAFCRERGILTIVDATQSMGAIPLSLNESGADVIMASNYKWMNAGYGTGLMAARRDFLERYPPKIRGNHSRMLQGEKWTDNASILGYEPGHLNVPGLILLECALEDRLATGVASIQAHNMRLTKQLIEGLNQADDILIGPVNMNRRSSIIGLRGGAELHEQLTRQGFVLSLRHGVVRLSLHYHNHPEEVDALVSLLNNFPKQTH
ncbi:MAG: aminotransferase class V-fold PLP-dependent enzyme [Cryomorphaceae bacterium]|nr:MAG: aminotransferase class V-fold PLP-dependent enzyme [Cryomorphaceae bacterium]